MDYIEKMLFNFAWKLNNYRKFESDEDMFKLIDEFLTEYDPYNQPERSKREDFSCKRIEDLEALVHSAIGNDRNEWYLELAEDLLKEEKMRCSELYGNIERDK